MIATREKSNIELEFEDVDSKNLWAPVYQRIRSESNAYDYTLDDAKKSDNRHLNRYRDVIPYDHSRILLNRSSTDYINANLVEIEQADRKYILTQGPLPNTIEHFWVMVWEQNCKAIVMLNKIVEKNQLKCSQYWPKSTNLDDKYPDVNLIVHLESEVNHSYYVTRHLRVTDTATSEEREIILFHYTTWPDFGVPQSPTALLKFIRAVRKSGALAENVGPPIVHCSAGIGRSGTFILVDCCLKLISDKGVDSVNVQEILLEMRHYRMGLIQTPDQLRFSYQAIIEGILTKWEDENEDTLSENVEPEEKPSNGISDPISSSDEENAPPIPKRDHSLVNNKPLPPLPVDDDDTEPISDKSNSRSSSPESDIQSDTSSNTSQSNSTNNAKKRKNEEHAERIADKQNDVEEQKKSRLESDISSNTKSLSVDSGSNQSNSTNSVRKRKYEEKTERISDKVSEMLKKQKDVEEKKKKSLERWAFAMKLLSNPYSIFGLGGILTLGGLYFYVIASGGAHHKN